MVVTAATVVTADAVECAGKSKTTLFYFFIHYLMFKQSSTVSDGEPSYFSSFIIPSFLPK
jgi:hypothetical protein